VPEATDFLYPFIEGGERDATGLLADLARSAHAKAADSRQLATDSLSRWDAELLEVATKLAQRLSAGGRIFTFGNGGSSTDASSLAAMFSNPTSGQAFPALALTADQAILTALGNDVGFELVFSRQVIAYGRPSDVAVGYSTSGNSENVVRAFAEARRRGLMTLGFAGYDGGQMASCGHLDHCIIVGSDSVHRIQETQDCLSLALWSMVQTLVQKGERL
jgi:D-sedoheptulose 7-phosphate isomerase